MGAHPSWLFGCGGFKDPNQQVNGGPKDRVEEVTVLLGGAEGLAEEASDETAAIVVNFVGFAIKARGTAVRPQDARGEYRPSRDSNVPEWRSALEVVIEKSISGRGQWRCRGPNVPAALPQDLFHFPRVIVPAPRRVAHTAQGV